MKKRDILGPGGNAFSLLALAQSLSKQLDLDEAKIHEEMTSGNYNDLLTVFNKYFGSVVMLVSPIEIPDVDPTLYTIDDKNEYI